MMSGSKKGGGALCFQLGLNKALAVLIRFQLTSKLTVSYFSVVWDDSFKQICQWHMRPSLRVTQGEMLAKTIKAKPARFL